MKKLASRIKAVAWICLLLICACAAGIPIKAAPTKPTGTVYYVATNGNDSNPGTSLNQPFRTIQKCATVAVAGDTCFIRSGTYRETVTPAHSGTDGNPITFTAYATETVTISGAEVITGWTLHTHPSGHVYRANMPWSLNVRSSDPAQVTNNQIFVDGQMMPEARWPNIPVANLTRLKNTDKARADSATVINTFTATYNDAALNVFPTNFWAGAKINFGPGFGIIHTTCDVTDSTPGSVRFQCNPDPGAYNNRSQWGGSDAEFYRPSTGNYYYLWGKYEALDAAGEWFRDDAGNLYLWPPDSGSPTAHLVEAKRRLWAFDLSGRSYITLDGLNIFAATIKTDDQTNHTLLQNLDLRYPWHFQEISPLHWRNGAQGIEFQGDDNILRDSNLTDSAGLMIVMSGYRNQAINNVVHDGAYMGNTAAIAGGTDDWSNPGGALKNVLRQNTIFDTGRMAVQADSGLDITYNDLYNSHLQIMDLGTVYSWGTDGKDAEIAYNLVHDNQAELNERLNYYGGHGIYLDDDTYNFRIYRNIIWNTTSPGITLNGTNGTSMPDPKPLPSAPSNRSIYNNTVDGILRVNAKPDYNGLPQTLNGVELKNNIASTSEWTDPSLTAQSNYTGDGLYLDRAAHNYRLRDYSPAVDAGLNLGSPYMDDPMVPVGLPDIGALERGRIPFVAGAVLRSQDLPALNVMCAPDANGSTATCTVTNLPLGRKAPNDFQIRIGGTDGAAAQDCVTHMDYNIHLGTVACARVSTNSLTGTQPVFIRLGSGSWLTTSRPIDLGPLVISAISPNWGFTSGGTSVTLRGRRFDTTPPGYSVPITLSNPSGTKLYNYQVLVQLDTAGLIEQGKLRGDCGDLRFSDSYGNLDYWLEEGCSTPNTHIWVKAVYIPTGTSWITLTYGNSGLTSASDGRKTFVFFDDFEDGVIGPYWQTGGGNFYTVTETGGKMVMYGRTNAASPYDSGSFFLDIDKLVNPASFAIDSEMSVITGSLNFKSSPGTHDDVLALWGSPGGSPPGKSIGYYNDDWQFVGRSTISTATFINQKISVGYTGDTIGRTVYWMENGDLHPLAIRADVTNPWVGFFTYGPDSVASFDVHFDNVRIRNFLFPEPVTVLGAESWSGLRLTFDGTPCRNLSIVDSTTLICVAPPHSEGAVDVTVTNPDSTNYTLTDGFTYVPTRFMYLPVVLRQVHE